MRKTDTKNSENGKINKSKKLTKGKNKTTKTQIQEWNSSIYNLNTMLLTAGNSYNLDSLNVCLLFIMTLETCKN